MKNKYQKTIYNLVHLSKADMTNDGVYIDRKKLQEDINVLWELYNNYQKLVDKETPKKPIQPYIDDCPHCKEFMIDTDEYKKYGIPFPNHCPKCGQKLDWSDENDK